jgi:hypothetical protein
MESLIVYLRNKKKLAALKTFMKAFDISFEETKSPYSAGFIEMMKQCEEDLKAGKGVKVDVDNLWK